MWGDNCFYSFLTPSLHAREQPVGVTGRGGVVVARVPFAVVLGHSVGVKIVPLLSVVVDVVGHTGTTRRSRKKKR